MSKWIPDRKVWAGGATMVVAWLIVQVLDLYAGADIPLGADAALAFALGKAVEYLVPPSARDLITKLDDEIVAYAGRSSVSEVSASVGAAAVDAIVDRAREPISTDFDAMMARITGR